METPGDGEQRAAGAAGEPESSAASQGLSERERLLRFVTAPVHRFALALVTADRAAVLEQAREEAAAEARRAGMRVATVALRAHASIVDQLVTGVRAGEPPVDVLMVTGLDRILLDELDGERLPPEIDLWNRSRDQLPALLDARVVLWLSRRASRALGRAARDLTDLVATRVHLDTPLGPELAPTAPRVALDRGSTVPRDLAMDEDELDDVLAHRDQTSAAWADAAVQRARVAVRRGEVDRARELYDRAIATYRAAALPMAAAYAQLDLADLDVMQGRLDDALLTLRKDVLPMFVDADDERGRAITMGQVADILQARGDLDEALRIRRDVQLPVYERLGDVRARAITMGKVADILQARGDLDEAIRLFRNEALPALANTDQGPSYVHVAARLADLLDRRGSEDDRSLARTLRADALERATAMKLPIADRLRERLRR